MFRRHFITQECLRRVSVTLIAALTPLLSGRRALWSAAAGRAHRGIKPVTEICAARGVWMIPVCVCVCVCVRICWV